MLTHRKIMSAQIAAGLFALLFVGISGCAPKFPDCKSNDNCKESGPAGNILLLCCDGTCQECCSDPDCPADRNRCKSNRCVECSEDQDCPAERPICENEKCVRECEIDADCARRGKDGMLCKDGKCQWECETDADCGSGKECKDHRCVVKCKCQSDTDCPEGKSCEDCECIARACNLEAIHFDFNRYDLRSGDRAILDRNAQCLKSRPDLSITIEGHCDERGTTEYNAALGDKRAKSARKYLENLGIPKSRLNTISFGEERPVCNDQTESCWSENRRSEFK